MSTFGRPLSLVLAVFCSFSVWAQQPTKSSAPPDYSHEAFVYEQIASKLTFENDGTATRDISARVRIQSDAAVQHFGLLRFSYQASNETMDVPTVRVLKPDGTTVVTPADGIQDMASDITREAPFYSDLREKHVAVKGLGVGDVVEYHYRSSFNKPLAPGQFWTAWNFTRDGVVLSEILEISVPRDRAIKLASPGVAPVVTNRDRYRVYAWTTSNPKAEVKDENVVLTQAARGQLPGPDIRLSSFQSWDEVGNWYGGLQSERVKPSPEIQAKAAELTKGASSDDAKLQAIYKYVSTQYRYIGIAFGIGRYQPHSAAEVLANQYGDCNDKHTLLASLLAAAGIKAYPALINSSRLIDPDVPSPGQFDHVISVIPQGNKLLWLDTTPGVSPFGFLVGPLRDKPALLISDNQPVALTLTPADPPFSEIDDIRIEGKLSDTDVLTARFDRTVRGGNEALLRAAFRQYPESQWKELGQGISFALGFGGTVSDVIADAPENIQAPFHFSYAYTRTDFGGDWGNHRILPPIPAMLLALRKNDEEKPQEPIWLGSPHEAHSETRLELPKGYTPELPQGVHLKEDFAEYHTTYSFAGGFLIAKVDFTTKLREIPVAEFDRYKSFNKAMENDRYQYIQLSESSSSPIESDGSKLTTEIWRLPDSKDPNALKYENEAREALQRGDPLRAIEDLKNAVNSDSKFLRDWLLLAISDEGVHKPDQADEAFRRAIAADPTQPLAYKMLAFSLMSQRKHEDAVRVWQDFIKADPNDGDGPANLAAALFQLKRYTESAAAYESAIKLGPLTANLEGRLGSAYLRAGDDDAASVAFAKAVELDTTPDSKNMIAYELAEADKKLLLALDYAKQAVTTLEEQSRKIEIAILKTADLEPTRSLGAYWDTLGWVYYKMDNLSQAENYLQAAWTVSQDPVVADHLGQLYEKQHKTSAAIHMYRWALAASPRFEEANQHLAKLHGSTADHDQVMAGSELSTMRTVKLPRFTSSTGSSEVFVLVSRNKIEDVLFLSGSEKFKPTKAMFPPTSFRSQFPAESSAFLLRRGILSCFSYTGCGLVVYTPNTVRSIN